jgi:N-acylneuraminate cytidylyltransferase
MEVLALIPARGGSKSIPRKNIRLFAGHPLIAYSIAAGLAAETVSRVLVSTDDPEIAEIAQRYGAQVPFLRPAEFSADQTPDLPVFQHALEWLAQNEGYRPEIVVQLRPTSPLRRVWHIDQAVYRLIEHPAADAIRTVCAPFQNPFKMWQIGPDGFMHPLLAGSPVLNSLHAPSSPALGRGHEPYNLPRQSLPDVYWQTGYVDAAWADTILTKASMTGDRILPLIIDPSEWIDIDSPDDWRRASSLLENGEITFADLGFEI